MNRIIAIVLIALTFSACTINDVGFTYEIPSEIDQLMEIVSGTWEVHCVPFDSEDGSPIVYKDSIFDINSDGSVIEINTTYEDNLCEVQIESVSIYDARVYPYSLERHASPPSVEYFIVGTGGEITGTYIQELVITNEAIECSYLYKYDEEHILHPLFTVDDPYKFSKCLTE